MIRLEIGLEIRHRGVMSMCTTGDKTVVVVVASYRSVSRNPVRFNALPSTNRKMTEPGCTKLAIVQLLFASASSSLTGRQ